MPEYIIERGTHRRRDGSRAEPGDRVTLTDRQVEQFNMARFTPVDDASASSDEATTIDDDGGEPTDDTGSADGAVELPDDYRTLQQMAVAYDGDEVNGATSGADLRAFFSDLDADTVADLRAAAADAV